MDNDYSKRDRIIAAIIILIILLLGGWLGYKVSIKIPSATNNNSVSKKISSALKMPFYYVIEYPKIIMGLSSGELPTYTPPKKNKPHKQFIKFPNN